MTRIFIILLLMGSSLTMNGQEKEWTVDDCIQYAITHNHEVRLQQIQLDDYKTDKQRAVGAFLPAVEASVGGQFNFGRAIDPETNTYTNVNTFNNSYGVQASIPLFDGLQRYNDLRAAKANLLMGRQGLAAQKDKIAQHVLKAYIDALYYQTALTFAKEKREESMMLLHQTQVMVEVGTKGEADIAQMEATYASDDYEVTRQEGLLSQALLMLKHEMNYPAEEDLEIKNEELRIKNENNSSSLQSNSHSSFFIPNSSLTLPSIQQAAYQLQSAQYAYRSSKGALFPSIHLGVGVSTNYFRQMGANNGMTFRDQFRNNVGEYLYASLTIPLFNRMNTISNIRRQRNNVKRARENLDNERRELHRLIQETAIDQQNSWMETQKMQQKVEADSLAAQLTIRKYQEGISSSIDVQTATVTLLQSKAHLLQCQLNYIYKTRILKYYQEGVWH
ncbi:MAG: TolC family protein [Bacteroidaceae bacterium]|nr:TolC family protein [Bacteroidaceae bacterium]